ncbi:MAG: pilus assembly PilX N-terminal domain-containing protein [Deltaproteobacteria bacterium]|nr:pilus assembly PilX N-terminal domain-containing protein [Deltaproteobacteria bacterium]
MESSNNPNRNPVSNEKGVALVTALILLVIISGLGIFGINTSIVEGWRSSNYLSTKNAHFAADAGVEDGISRLVSGVVSDSGSETSTTWNNGNTYNSTNFSNSFTIGHRLVGNPSVVATTATNNPHYLIRSTGTTGTARKTIEAIIALNLSSNSPFTDALTGCNGVTFSSNASTSSYSSSGQTANGHQGSVRTTNSNANITFSSNADIDGAVKATGAVSLASNTILRNDVQGNNNITMSGNAKISQNAYSGGSISLSNNSLIYGNATAAGSISQSSNADIYGIESPNTPPASPYVPTSPCDPLNVTNLFATANNSGNNNNSELSGAYYSGGAFSIGSNNSTTLGSSSQSKGFYLTGFTMSSNSHVTVYGNVTLYVDGNFSLSSNTYITLASGSTLTVYATGTFTLNSNTSINNSGRPQALAVYSNAQSTSSTDYKVNLDSNSGLRGVVYAPNSAVHIASNADLYGSIRGNFVQMASNAEFHYDEDLSSANFGGGGTPSGYTLLNRREIYN